MPVDVASDRLPADGIPSSLRDGYEVHAAALGHGFDVLLLPRQLLMARMADADVELAFVHGVPSTSDLAAVTFAQDKHMRREMLERAGLPVPPGAHFRLSRQEEAKQFAGRIGYPVVIKPNIGDNLVEVFSGIADEAELDAAIRYFRTPEADRPAHSRSAYSLTMLGEPGEEDGQAVAPQSYQFLLERHVPGEYVRFLVLDGKVYSALHLAEGPGDGDPTNTTVVTDQVHTTIADMAVRAAVTVPGLALAIVDVVVGSLDRPADSQDVWVVELSERPTLATWANVDLAASRSAAQAVFLQHAAGQQVDVGEPTEEVSLAVRIEGLTDATAALPALESAGRLRDVSLAISNVDKIEGAADATMHGRAAEVAALSELLLAGQLEGHRAMLVHARHVRT